MLEVSIVEHTRPEKENTKDLGLFRHFKIRKNFRWITSFAEFLNQKIKNEQYYNQHLKWIEEKLRKIKEYLVQQNYKNTDPLQYLWYLYHEESLSTRDISKRLSSIGVSYSVSWLLHLFKETFWWEMRENFDEWNPITKKKNTRKIRWNISLIEGKKRSLERQNQEIKQKVSSLLSDITLEQDTYQFDKKKYNAYKKDFDKIDYVFSIYINKSIYSLVTDLKNEWFKAPTIATLINSLCKELLLINEAAIEDFPETSKNAIAYILNKKNP